MNNHQIKFTIEADALARALEQFPPVLVYQTTEYLDPDQYKHIEKLLTHKAERLGAGEFVIIDGVDSLSGPPLYLSSVFSAMDPVTKEVSLSVSDLEKD